MKCILSRDECALRPTGNPEPSCYANCCPDMQSFTEMVELYPEENVEGWNVVEFLEKMLLNIEKTSYVGKNLKRCFRSVIEHVKDSYL